MTFESKPLRMAVASLPCANCGLERHSQAAHSNLYEHGKGRGLKASDAATFPLCVDRVGQQGCHTKFDQYKLCSKQEMPAMTARFIAWTHVQLLERRLLKVA
jgi:hypothetical protein